VYSVIAGRAAMDLMRIIMAQKRLVLDGMSHNFDTQHIMHKAHGERCPRQAETDCEMLEAKITQSLQRNAKELENLQEDVEALSHFCQNRSVPPGNGMYDAQDRGGAQGALAGVAGVRPAVIEIPQLPLELLQQEPADNVAAYNVHSMLSPSSASSVSSEGDNTRTEASPSAQAQPRTGPVAGAGYTGSPAVTQNAGLATLPQTPPLQARASHSPNIFSIANIARLPGKHQPSASQQAHASQSCHGGQMLRSSMSVSSLTSSNVQKIQAASSAVFKGPHNDADIDEANGGHLAVGVPFRGVDSRSTDTLDGNRLRKAHSTANLRSINMRVPPSQAPSHSPMIVNRGDRAGPSPARNLPSSSATSALKEQAVASAPPLTNGTNVGSPPLAQQRALMTSPVPTRPHMPRQSGARAQTPAPHQVGPVLAEDRRLRTSPSPMMLGRNLLTQPARPVTATKGHTRMGSKVSPERQRPDVAFASMQATGRKT